MARSGLPIVSGNLTHIDVPERGYSDISPEIWNRLQLSDDFRKLHCQGVIDVAFLSKGVVRLKGTCYVGHAICDDISLDLREKVEGALGILLAYASHNSFRVLRAHSGSSEIGGLFPILVSQFLDTVKRYVSAGRGFSYTKKKAVGSLAGGRLDITKTIQLRARGLGHLLAYEKNEVTFNVPVNRIVLAALSEIERLSRSVPMSNSLVSTSRGLSMLFADCRDHELLYRQRLYFADLAARLGDLSTTELSRDMMMLAAVILGHRSFESTSEAEGVAPRTWFVNLENLFESAVRRVLATACGQEISVRKGDAVQTHIFDIEKKRYRAKPDLVISSDVGVVAVGDVKYKNLEDYPKAGDAYQLLAHTSAFDCRLAFLIFPGPEYSCVDLGGTRDGIRALFFTVRIENLVEDLNAVATRLGCGVEIVGPPQPVQTAAAAAVA